MCYEAFKPFCVTVLVSLKNNSILTEFEFNTFKPYKEFSLICNGILLEKKKKEEKIEKQVVSSSIIKLL